ncbi:hypothetical protein [Sodalis praecaptivus]|uniref:hypothetical protein n=1 Tax=Sodalis praecaptivus TaxID=1239307 RepID=UPI00280C22C8|nr:hypothetical protein [Sodalis praecaptivus]
MDLPLGTTLTVFTAVLAGYATAGEKKTLARALNASPPARSTSFDPRYQRATAGENASF